MFFLLLTEMIALSEVANLLNSLHNTNFRLGVLIAVVLIKKACIDRVTYHDKKRNREIFV